MSAVAATVVTESTPVWLAAAATAVREAQCLVVCAGAGMGVDSGLPDFRGPEGFWQAYPPMKQLGLRFADVSNPRSFADNPRFGWGFFGHRYHLYAQAVPHTGYHILRRWMQRLEAPQGTTEEQQPEQQREQPAAKGFVFTSNVDGQFLAAGFAADRLVECHGSIHHLQCFAGCHRGIWPAVPTLPALRVDPTSFLAEQPLPRCQRCDGLARPNILMFGDRGWVSDRTDAQEARFERFCEALPRETRLVVVELGAGLAVPTVRLTSEDLVDRFPHAKLIRVNPRESDGPRGTISVPLGARQALQMIDDALGTPAC